jgi:hypothetical protein
MDEINPYAPPKSTEWDEFRYTEINPVAWRDGNRLMVMKDAILPGSNSSTICDHASSRFVSR